MLISSDAPLPVTAKPQFQHDCVNCIFLGHVVINGKAADIYVCPCAGSEPKQQDLVWRHSDEPADYGWTLPALCSPLSIWSVVALSLYVKHLGANQSNALERGAYSKDGRVVLNLNEV